MVFLLAKQRRLYRDQSITDPLTGLSNRRHTEARVKEVIAHAVSRGGRAVVTIIDMDHFKSCNDRYGHDAGDDALKTFATLFQEAIRPGDIFGRWGGEEFLLALPDAGPEDARAILERVAEKAADTTVALAPDYPLRFSGGAVDVPRSAKSLEEALLLSDQLLYAAKAAGRSRIHYAG
jgi:diguanylate cyclase (GGDEF)-like protein